MGRVGRGVRDPEGIVEQIHIAIEEHSFPGYEDIVEENHTVHLLEPRPQRVIEVGAAVVEAVTTQETQPG